ncbi:MAG TPA: hypothetical protein V6D03_03640, partial [Candidatus Caenarcaniphilales bacterium]
MPQPVTYTSNRAASSDTGTSLSKSGTSSLKSTPPNPSPSPQDLPLFPIPAHQYASGIYGGTATSVKAPPGISTNPVAPQRPTDNSATSEVAASPANWSTSLQNVLDQPPSALPQRLLLGGMIFSLA